MHYGCSSDAVQSTGAKNMLLTTGGLDLNKEETMFILADAKF